MKTVRIFAYTTNVTGMGVYDMERKLTLSYRTRIVADDHCPLSYIFRTLENFGITRPDDFSFPKEIRPRILWATDVVWNFRDGGHTLYHATFDGFNPSDMARINAAYQKFLAR